MLVNKNAIESKYVNLYSFLNGKKIGIPIFQRFYAWKPVTTKQLLEDIKSALDDDEKDLYLLDIIYYQEDGKIMLADGQQRVVTLNILIKAIKDFAFANGKQIDDIDLFDVSYDIIDNQIKYDHTFDNYPVAPFKRVYTSLLEYIKEHKSKINNIINIIKNRLTVYAKECQNADEAFSIFQQINTGGRPLTKDDIIKTAIDQYSKSYGIPINTKKIKEIKTQLGGYYRFINDNPNADFDNVAIMSFLKEHVTKDRDSFNKFVQTIEALRRLEGNPLTHVCKYINRMSLFDVINILAMKGIDTNTNRQYLEKVVMPLCMVSIILSIKGGNPTVIKYLINQVVPMIKEDKTPSEIQYCIGSYINENSSSCRITFSEFKEALGKQTLSQGIKKALLILDVIKSNTSGTLNVDSVNLEHIYPQNPTKWVIHGWPSSTEEANKYVHNIGNYLLLNEPVNKSISNEYISYKRVKYEEIIHRDRLLQTDINTVDFQEFETRKMSYILERQAKIAEKIRATLPLADALIIVE